MITYMEDSPLLGKTKRLLRHFNGKCIAEVMWLVSHLVVNVLEVIGFLKGTIKIFRKFGLKSQLTKVMTCNGCHLQAILGVNNRTFYYHRSVNINKAANFRPISQ